MMLASDGVRLAVNASSFDRQLLGLTDYYSSRTMDLSLGSATAAAAAAHHHHLSDCDRQEESLASSKSSHEQTGRSSRRKQSAPRSRLARQCDRCDFSSSNPTEFELHFKNEHSDEQVFNCEICSFSSSSALEYHFHLQSHNDMTSSRNHLALPETSTLTIDDDDDDDEHQLNIDESKDQEHEQDQQMQIDEQSSDDDDLNSSSTDLNKKFNHSVTSTPSSNINNAPPAALPDRKRPYNVSVDPARYRRVTDPDDPSAVKFACSLCGNLYKWRKSLNKHWKEKHNEENPPPLDAPVTIRPSKSSQSKSLQTITSDSLPLNMKSSSSNVLPIPSSSTSSNVPSNAQHHSAFAFNPFAWLKLASSMPNAAAVAAAAAFESTLNAPLDLRIKSNDDHHSALAAAAAAAVQHQHQQQQQMNQMGHANESDDDDGGRDSSDDTSSSSPQNSYGQKMFICSVCDQRFLSVETINEHFLKNHLHELENEIAGKSPPRNTNVAQQNEEWNLSDPNNPLKCIKCDFVGRWPTELQKHAASHSTSRPFKCLVCSLTYKWRWDLAKHWDRAHACSGKGVNLINPYKKRDRDQARSMMDLPSGVTMKSKTSTTMSADRQSISSANSNEHSTKNHAEQSDEEEQSQNSILSDNDDEPQQDLKRFKNEQEKNNLFLLPPPPPAVSSGAAAAAAAFNPSMYFPPPFFPHHPMFSSFLNPSLLLQPKLNYSPRLPMNPTLDLFKQSSSGFVQQTASPNSSRSSSSSSSSPRPSSPLQNHQRRQAVAAMLAVAAGHSASTNPSIRPPSQQGQTSMTTPTRRIEKEERNFQCRWCDYRGRWRSELIQHMRCHHARDKPYHCSACPYASSWKWDVQKHVKKQHAHNTARIVELPDKYLFQTTLKAKYEGTDDRNLAPPPLTEDDYSFFGADVQEKLSSMKYTRDRTLSCQQCPFAANSMAELRRHLIVHSTESPYHCFNCNYKSKWKCDVKKHMRICNHHGPVLVGRKAMAKVMESLGLVISNNNQRAMATEKVNEEDDDEDEIIVDENQAEEEEEEREPEEQEDGTEEKDKTISNNSRASNHHLRCRQCDYEADDLSDLLIHRKAHASMKNNKNDTDRKHNSDIENDDQEQIHPTEPLNLDNEQIFNYELQWLENNPAMKRFTTVHEKTQSILYQCSKCHYQINTHQNFLNHIDHHHSEVVEDHL